MTAILCVCHFSYIYEYKTIEKLLELPDELQMIVLFVYIFSLSKNRIPQPYAKSGKFVRKENVHAKSSPSTFLLFSFPFLFGVPSRVQALLNHYLIITLWVSLCSFLNTNQYIEFPNTTHCCWVLFIQYIQIHILGYYHIYTYIYIKVHTYEVVIWIETFLFQ